MAIELYEYQKPGVEKALEAFKKQQLYIFAWEVGTGKTVAALEINRRLNPDRTLVIAPKSTLGAWRATAVEMESKADGILNIEKLKTGKTEWVEKESKFVWSWKFDKDESVLVILDEAQCAGGMDSQNAFMIAFLKQHPNAKVLMLSATIAENPLRLRALLCLAELVKWKGYHRFCLNHGCYRDQGITGAPWRFDGRAEHMRKIHTMLFPNYGDRLTTSQIEGYPECVDEVIMLTPSPKSLKLINQLYEEMDAKVRDPKLEEHEIVQLLRHRQRIELEKVPLFVEEAVALVEEHRHHVVAFFNYRESMYKFAEMIEDELGYKVPLIHGTQTDKEREESMAIFQANEVPVLAAIAQAGGVGINLNDVDGRYPRTALINPPVSATLLTQVRGRVHRSNNKSLARNRIILASGNRIEERIYASLRRKIINMGVLQEVRDEDLNFEMWIPKK